MLGDETVPPPVPTASIRSYLDRQLTVVTVEGGYELRHEERLLGWLENEWQRPVIDCATADGSWQFALQRDRRVLATNRGASEEVIASFAPGLVTGGTIDLPDAPRLRLRAPALGETWRVRRGLRGTILTIRAPAGPWEIDFMAAARELYHLPLLTMLAFHVLQREASRYEGGAAGGGGA
jgi:hypothetical protein